MLPLELWGEWREARFLARPNRFTLRLECGGRPLEAFIPNTGRIEEYLVEGGVFYVAPSRTPKFSHRVVSTMYQGSYVLLDTCRINDLVGELLHRGKLPGLEGWRVSARERSIGDIRPDFVLESRGGGHRLLEVKTCTLCHNGVALFPDAPSLRASRHLERLASFADGGQAASMVFAVPHGGARTFMPNFHTDPAFSRLFLSVPGRVELRPFSVSLTDPATVDLDSVRELAVDLSNARAHGGNGGTYAIVLRNDRARRIEVGRLGVLTFEKGYYVYVGSALDSLDARVARHARAVKKPFWHIDRIAPRPMPVVKTFAVRRRDRIEADLAARVRLVAESAVEGFGSSDSTEPSHLFRFEAPPHRLRPFMDIILDYRTFTEGSRLSPTRR